MKEFVGETLSNNAPPDTPTVRVIARPLPKGERGLVEDGINMRSLTYFWTLELIGAGWSGLRD